MQMEGKIIFWNGSFGFIQTDEFESYFFHKSDVKLNPEKPLKLLDQVEFNVKGIADGKYAGKIVGYNVNFIKRGKLSEYDKYVGKLTDWDGRSGFIKSPQQEILVRFFETRKLNKHDSFKDGGLVIFHQVKSSYNPNQLFALFAYPLEKENNYEFLIQQFLDSGQNEIQDRVIQILQESKGMKPKLKFNAELKLLGYIDNTTKYIELKRLIEKYKSLGYLPSYDALSEYCATPYLIQLWESGSLDMMNLKLIKDYFYRADANKKRILFPLISEERRNEVLLFYYENLLSEGKISGANNYLKTFLDLAYRSKDKNDISVYQGIKEQLFAILKPVDLLNLSLNGYLDELPEKYVTENVDIDNHDQIKDLVSKNNLKYISFIKKLYEDYFLEVRNLVFENEFPRLVNRLQIFISVFQDDYSQFISSIENLFSDSEKFNLWLFGIRIDIDATRYFKLNHNTINDFLKIRFFNQLPEPNIELFNELGKPFITEPSLEFLAKTIKWNSLIVPAPIIPNNPSIVSFLGELEIFKDKYVNKDLDINKYALLIFQSMPYYNAHHLRLWINNYVSDSYYDFVGFRSHFRELSLEEQKLFKNKGDAIDYNSEVIDPEINEVEPCDNIISIDGAIKLYSAAIKNIYFENGTIMLRMEDHSYTKPFRVDYSSSGLNRIPAGSILNDVEILIKVNGATIAEPPKGLDELFESIHTGEITAILSRINVYGDSSSVSSKAYVEDWNLRKQIIEYLHTNQISQIEPTTVYEPRLFIRQKDTQGAKPKKELTRLFSIKTNNGIGIIWENIDLSYDRATYVFKVSDELHRSQLEKISRGIVSFLQFRSLLSDTEANFENRIFKKSYGFVKSIRKRRGDNMSFENWRDKLLAALAAEIPDLPSDDELEILKNWQPEAKHSINISPKIRLIQNESIKTVNMAFESSTMHKHTTSQKMAVNSKRSDLLNSLQMFNNTFLKDFKI